MLIQKKVLSQFWLLENILSVVIKLYTNWISRRQCCMMHERSLNHLHGKEIRCELLLCDVISSVGWPGLPWTQELCAGLKKSKQAKCTVTSSAIDYQRGSYAWCRVTMCNYKAGAQGFDKMKACYLQPCDLLCVNSPWNKLHLVLCQLSTDRKFVPYSL